MNEWSAYGHWQLVFTNSLILLTFTVSFFRPVSKRDWRTFGAFAAFVIALFTEMYGFPLTIYLLSGWLTRRFPEMDWFSHGSSHLFQTLLGWRGDPHYGPVHLVSNLLIVCGLLLLGISWRVLFAAQKNGRPATTGPYAWVRHPQYTALMMIMSGFLVQWPTFPTIVMFLILVWIYVRLAVREEHEAKTQFGGCYLGYAQNTPRFLPLPF